MKKTPIFAQEKLLDVLNPKLFHINHVANWRKPDPGMLLAAASRFGIEPEMCLFVGDMQSDKEAAGMMFESFAGTHGIVNDIVLEEPE